MCCYIYTYLRALLHVFARFHQPMDTVSDVNWCRYFEKIAIDPNVNVKHMQAIRVGAVHVLCSQIVILHLRLQRGSARGVTKLCSRTRK